MSKTKKEYIIFGQKRMAPSHLYATVFKPNKEYLGAALISMDQWNDSKFMDRLIGDMETMAANGVGMAIIDDSVRGGENVGN